VKDLRTGCGALLIVDPDMHMQQRDTLSRIITDQQTYRTAAEGTAPPPTDAHTGSSVAAPVPFASAVADADAAFRASSSFPLPIPSPSTEFGHGSSMQPSLPPSFSVLPSSAEPAPSLSPSSRFCDSVHSSSLLQMEESASVHDAVASLLFSERDMCANEYQLLLVSREQLLTPDERQACKRPTAMHVVADAELPSQMGDLQPQTAAGEHVDSGDGAVLQQQHSQLHAQPAPLFHFQQHPIVVTADAPCRQIGDQFEEDD